MEDSQRGKKKKAGTAKLTSSIIATALDSPQAHTSFGKVPLSKEKTNPIYGFGTGNREKMQKVYYDEELNVPTRNSPGPKYQVKDNINFKTAPNFSFGTDKRVTLGRNTKYDYYEIYDPFTDPIHSKNYTQKNYGNTKFGTEPRLPAPEVQGTPGPQYLPPHRPEIKKSPQYSLGVRRPQPDVLKNQVSTPGICGPGRYVPEASAYTSYHKNSSKWTIGKGDKLGRMPKSVTKNQTYYTASSCGNQVVSSKKTKPNVKIGTASREQVSKLGSFADWMSNQPTRVRMPHPNF